MFDILADVTLSVFTLGKFKNQLNRGERSSKCDFDFHGPFYAKLSAFSMECKTLNVNFNRDIQFSRPAL